MDTPTVFCTVTRPATAAATATRRGLSDYIMPPVRILFAAGEGDGRKSEVARVKSANLGKFLQICSRWKGIATSPLLLDNNYRPLRESLFSRRKRFPLSHSKIGENFSNSLSENKLCIAYHIWEKTSAGVDFPVFFTCGDSRQV